MMDYAHQEKSNLALGALARQLARVLLGTSIQLRASYGPFQDGEGLASHFDGAAGRRHPDIMRKGVRDAASFLPDLVVGFGQGAVISALVRWPLMAEVTLQARNLQNKEVQKVRAAWGGIKGSGWWTHECGKASLKQKTFLAPVPNSEKAFLLKILSKGLVLPQSKEGQMTCLAPKQAPNAPRLLLTPAPAERRSLNSVPLLSFEHLSELP